MSVHAVLRRVSRYEYVGIKSAETGAHPLNSYLFVRVRALRIKSGSLSSSKTFISYAEKEKSLRRSGSHHEMNQPTTEKYQTLSQQNGDLANFAEVRLTDSRAEDFRPAKLPIALALYAFGREETPVLKIIREE